MDGMKGGVGGKDDESDASHLACFLLPRDIF